MSKLIVGEKYYLQSGCWESWMDVISNVKPDTLLVLTRIESDGIHRFESSAGDIIFLEDYRVQWYDEQCAMREVVNEPVTESETEWRLPAGTFFRVNGKHDPLYLVMSNSHVFNLTAKQMHTTCSSRFKDKQLSVANVQMSEVL